MPLDETDTNNLVRRIESLERAFIRVLGYSPADFAAGKGPDGSANRGDELVVDEEKTKADREALGLKDDTYAAGRRQAPVTDIRTTTGEQASVAAMARGEMVDPNANTGTGGAAVQTGSSTSQSTAADQAAATGQGQTSGAGESKPAGETKPQGDAG